MLTKIHAKITIIVVENREPYFITICKCKEGPLSLFSYQMLASILTMDEWFSYEGCTISFPGSYIINKVMYEGQSKSDARIIL